MKLPRLLTTSSFALLAFVIATPAFAAGIDPAYKYAWSNVGGYINFAPTQGGLTITDSAITGYAWAANSGYINFDTNLSGVTNDGEGNLGGFAWGEGAGWISFTGVTIDDTGRFHGVAQGGTVNGASYAITFDCANCDVRTDWRPGSVGDDTDTDTGGSGSGGGTRVPTPPDAELPEEPTTPPPGQPNVPNEGTGNHTGVPQTDSNGDGIPDVYPTADLLNPASPDAPGTEEATSTPASSVRSLLIGGIILFLFALFFLILFWYRRRKAQ